VLSIKRIPWAGALFSLAMLLPHATLTAADPSEFTEAERQLFVTEHLRGLTLPTQLHYAVSRRGSLQSELDDSAELALSSDNGQTIGTVRFLSGTDQLKLPAVSGVKGNPILLHFLEREIREMNRLTGGSANYYRKRIRMALAKTPEVQDIELQFGGKTITAKQVRISPYVDDPARSRYEKFALREYEMVFSQQVPGGIFRLQGKLYGPGSSGDDRPLLWSETVSFERQTKTPTERQ